jgi:hypothetical protein
LSQRFVNTATISATIAVAPQSHSRQQRQSPLLLTVTQVPSNTQSSFTQDTLHLKLGGTASSGPTTSSTHNDVSGRGKRHSFARHLTRDLRVHTRAREPRRETGVCRHALEAPLRWSPRERGRLLGCPERHTPKGWQPGGAAVHAQSREHQLFQQEHVADFGPLSRSTFAIDAPLNGNERA